MSSVYTRGRKHVLTLSTCVKQTDNVVEYKTSSADVAFIGMCRKAYGRIAGKYIHSVVLVYEPLHGIFLSSYMLSSGWQSSRDWKDGDETYAGMVEVSRALMKVDNHHLQKQYAV